MLKRPMPAHSIQKIAGLRNFIFFILLLPLLAVAATAAESRLLPGHVPAAVASGKFKPLGRVPATNQMRLAFGLPLRNAEALTNLLAAIYTPGSPEFHHYLTPREFAARFGPRPEDYAAVLHFAATNGLKISTTHSNRLVVTVTGQAADVERALRIHLNFFRHPTEARNFFAPDREPVVDARLPLMHVSGLDNFSRPHPNLQRPVLATAKASPNVGSGPNGWFMGNDFRQAYVPGTALTGAGQSVGLLEFNGLFDSDVASYATQIGLTNNVPQRVIVAVDGGYPSPDDDEEEVALDVEMVMAMSPGVSAIYVYEAPNDNSLWPDLLSRMADDNLAQQLSCSWSGGAADPTSEEIFQQMAAQGQSFFAASGDNGAFFGLIDFPSDSPNITEVGGTYLNTDANGNYVSEWAWNRNDGVYSSGGGISPTYALPVWQRGVDMTANGGSFFSRNIPDVALTAENIYVFSFGQPGPSAGTSCAAPLWAGFTALVNQQAAELGQPPVGFLNPAIYALCRGANYAATFHDITIGNNTNYLSPTNFFAAPGYDLCTGWGSPMGTNFINALTARDFLGVTPATVSSSSDLAGGPFSKTNWILTLTNSGAADLSWTLGGAPNWLAISPPQGTLITHTAINLNVQLLNATALPAGNYLGVVLITNQALSRVQTFGVQLNIGQSIVVNGGFETGDFTGWTLVGDTITTNAIYNAVLTDLDFPQLAHSGTFGAHLSEPGHTATLSQTLVTRPGQRYLVAWWLDNVQYGEVQTFKANWNGTNYVKLTNPAAFPWASFQFVATATTTNTLLQFSFENDTNYFALDDVSATLVPPVALVGSAPATNAFQLTWNSLDGLYYQLQYKTNLAQTAWQDLADIAAATNVTAFVDTNAASAKGQRFYRLLLQP